MWGRRKEMRAGKIRVGRVVRTGAKMRPAMVSGIAIGDALVNYWPIFSPVPANSPISLCESNSTQFPCRFDCGELLPLLKSAFFLKQNRLSHG